MDDDFKIIEDTDQLVIKYLHAADRFDLVYDKSKDKVLLIKNGKPANDNVLRQDEKDKFKEILDIAICFHHDREGNENLN